jgi:predicted CXXCH cytochrome family protein
VKKTDYSQKIISYFVICCLSLSSFLYYLPGTKVLSAQGDLLIEILSPKEEDVFETGKAEFTGLISAEGASPESLTFKIYETEDEPAEPEDITNDGQLDLVFKEGYAEWSFSKEFEEGQHTILFVLEDEAMKKAEASYTFTLKTTVPPSQNQGDAAVTLNSDPVAEIPENEPAGTTSSIQPAEAASNDEPGADTSNDEPPKAGDEEKEKQGTEPETNSTGTAETEKEPVPRPYVTEINILPRGGEDRDGSLPAEDMTGVPVDASIEVLVKESGTLTFPKEPLILSSPTGKKMSSKESALGLLPVKKDGTYRIIFTPSEALEYSTTYYVFINPAISNNQKGLIFQRFLKFTTAPRVASHEIHGNFSNNTNSCANCHSTHNGNDPKLLGGKYGADTAKNLCMACHDGTGAAPMPDHANAANQHFNYNGDLKATYSCTTCHNPHTGWEADNPNKLKNHPAMAYKKQGTATGIAADFSLCLQCHNGSKAVDINKYYKESALRAESGHNIMAEDGSPLKGQLACADCHETHGSENLKMLKDNLGNAPLAEKDKHKTTGTEWTTQNERTFCLKCHNGDTELYGKKTIYNEEHTGHQDKSASCSSCHGTGTDVNEQMRSAAHAPKKLKLEPVSQPGAQAPPEGQTEPGSQTQLEGQNERVPQTEPGGLIEPGAQADPKAQLDPNGQDVQKEPSEANAAPGG